MGLPFKSPHHWSSISTLHILGGRLFDHISRTRHPIGTPSDSDVARHVVFHLTKPQHDPTSGCRDIEFSFKPSRLLHLWASPHSCKLRKLISQLPVIRSGPNFVHTSGTAAAACPRLRESIRPAVPTKQSIAFLPSLLGLLFQPQKEKPISQQPLDRFGPPLALQGARPPPVCSSLHKPSRSAVRPQCALLCGYFDWALLNWPLHCQIKPNLCKALLRGLSLLLPWVSFRVWSLGCLAHSTKPLLVIPVSIYKPN